MLVAWRRISRAGKEHHMRLAVARRNEQLDALINECNSGILRIYDGTRPADADTAVTTQVILAELTMNATSFAAASAGVSTANAITQDSSANAGGTATWARLFQSNGTTPVADFSVSATGGGGEIQFASTTFVAATAIQMTALTLTNPVGT
jgi:two-component sensor histidine kinase